jgi:hypothetical protein
MTDEPRTTEDVARWWRETGEHELRQILLSALERADGWTVHLSRAAQLPRRVDPRVVRELAGFMVGFRSGASVAADEAVPALSPAIGSQ